MEQRFFKSRMATFVRETIAWLAVAALITALLAGFCWLVSGSLFGRDGAVHAQDVQFKSVTADGGSGGVLYSFVNANTPIAGRLTLSGGTNSYTDTLDSFTTIPVCVAEDETTHSNHAYAVPTIASNQLTVTLHGTGTDAVAWTCLGGTK